MKATVLYLLAFERVPLPLHFMQSVGKTKSGKTFEKENWRSAALPITATVFFSVYLTNLRVCEEPHVYHTDRRVIRLGPRVKYCFLALQIYNRDKNLAKKLTSARHYSEVGRTVTKLLRILGHGKSTSPGGSFVRAPDFRDYLNPQGQLISLLKSCFFFYRLIFSGLLLLD